MTDKIIATNHNPDFYVTGGTMNRNARSYVSRQADIDLIESLQEGKFCYVLNSRQMGKSSLMVRSVDKLKDSGYAVAVLDLTTIGRNVTAEQWYDGLQLKIGEQLHLETELDEFWQANERLGPLQRWLKAMREVVLEKCRNRIVIFIDEVDVVHSLAFSTSEFFAGIRSLYNRREEDQELKRLNFCLIGVTTTSDLIQNAEITPLNIGGQRIELKDFTETDAIPLEGNLGRDKQTNRKLLKRILYWTGGHPYLTQLFCKEIAENERVKNERDIDEVCQKLFLSAGARDREDNLVFVRDKMLRSNDDLLGLLALYLEILKGEPIPNDDLNPFNKTLLLSGLVSPQSDGKLSIRNRIYENAFDAKWANVNMPDAELRKQRAIYRRRIATFVLATILMIFLSSFAGIQWVTVKRFENQLKSKNFELDELKAELKGREKVIKEREQELGIKNNDLKEKEDENHRQQSLTEKQTKLANDKTKEANSKDLEAKKQQKIAQNQTEIAEAKTWEAEKQKEIADNKTQEAKISEQKANYQQELANKMEEAAKEKNEEAEQLLYGANIKSIYSFYQSYDMHDFQEALYKINPNYRRIEWDYLNQLTAGDVKFDDLQKKGLSDIAFTPDGEYLLTLHAYSDNVLKWNLNTGSSQPVFYNGIVDSRFVFSPDKKWLANLVYSAPNLKLILRDISSSILEKEQIEISLEPDYLKFINKRSALFVAFTTDSKEVILISTGEKVINVQNWDIASKTKKETSYTETFEKQIDVKAVSPIGQILAYVYLNNNPIDEILLDSKLNKIQKPEYIFNDRIGMVYFSDDGKKICFKDVEGLYVFDTVSNDATKLPDNLTDPRELGLFFYNVTFSSNNELIAVVFREGIRIINLKKNKIIREFRSDNYGRTPTISFSPNNEFLAIGYPYKFNDDKNIIVLKLNKEDETFAFKDSNQVLDCEDCYINLNKDETRLITIDKDGQLILWNYLNEQKISTIINTPLDEGEKRRAEFLVKGLYFFSVIEHVDKANKRKYKNLQIWDATNGNEFKLQALSEFEILDFRFTPDENDLAVLYKGKIKDKIGLWNLRNGSVMWENEVESSRNFLYVNERAIGIFNSVNRQSYNYEIKSGLKIDDKQFTNEKVDLENDYERKTFDPVRSPDGNWTVYGDKNGYFLKNEKDSSKKNIQLQNIIEKNFLPNVIFSNDSQLLTFWGVGGNNYVKNLETFKDVPINGTFLDYIQFSPSNTWLFSRNGRGIVYINTRTGKENEIANCGSYYAPLLIFDEERVITGCTDGRIRFININSGQEVLSFKAHKTEIIALKISADGKKLLTVSRKDGAKWWRLRSVK